MRKRKRDREVLRKLERVGKRVAKLVLSEREPYLEIPMRTLSNTIWDSERRMLILGPRKARRKFFDLNESRKFMQTLLMLSLIIKARREGDYPTIRDLYYMGKHTIEYRDHLGKLRREETWRDQRESNSVIQDIEVLTGLLREQMGIMHDTKGKIVGNIVVRSKGYLIDCSKMGSGAYAIPPNPDSLEIVKVNAKYVLVIEKDAIFERLNEEEFWRRENCILITGKGQPDRSTRRMVRRLWEEYGLPTYVLTDCDSVTPDEVVVVRDRVTKRVRIEPIGELARGLVNELLEKELIEVPWEVLAWDPATDRIEWRSVKYLYRHKVNREILRLRTRGRGTIRVTPDHSLFVWRNGKVEIMPAKNIKPGDYIVVSKKLPLLWNGPYQRLRLTEALNYLKTTKSGQQMVLVLRGGSEVKLGNENHNESKFVYPAESKRRVFNNIFVDEDFAYILGLFIAEGIVENNDIVWHLKAHKIDLVKRVKEIVARKFGLKVHVYDERRDEVRVVLNSSLLVYLMKCLGVKSGIKNKRVPSVIINSPPSVQLSFLRGLFDGNGRIDKGGNVVYCTSNRLLAKQVSLLLQSLGINPTVLVDGEKCIIRVPITWISSEIRESSTSVKPKSEKTKSMAFGIPKTSAVHELCTWVADNECTYYSPKCKSIDKHRLAEGMLNAENSPERLKRFVEGPSPLTFGDVNLIEVVEVRREEYTGDVYDFTVPGCESFVGGYGVVYHNSYGFYIYSVYKSGSISLSYESARLATPGAKFLGLSVSDIDRYKIPRNFIIKATDRDLKRARELLSYPWFSSKAWQRELKLFLKRKEKVEIEALSGHGFKFLSHRYIPEKLKRKEWIE